MPNECCNKTLKHILIFSEPMTPKTYIYPKNQREFNQTIFTCKNEHLFYIYLIWTCYVYHDFLDGVNMLKNKTKSFVRA